LLFLLSAAAEISPARAQGAQSFVYVANSGSNNVSAYTIKPVTGALAAVVGSPFAAGSGPVSVTVDPAGQFAYVANLGSDNVSAFTINPATGALAAVSGSPFPAGTTLFPSPWTQRGNSRMWRITITPVASQHSPLTLLQARSRPFEVLPSPREHFPIP